MFSALLRTTMSHEWRLAAAAVVVSALGGAAAAAFLLTRSPLIPGRRRRASRRGGGDIAGSSADIPELKRAERELIAARDAAVELARRAEAAEAVAGVGHWRVDVASRAVTWSRELYRIYGFAPDAPLDLDAVLRMTHAEDAKAANERLARQMRTGEADVGSITRIVSANGETRYLNNNSAGEFDAGGAIVAVIGAVVDVTDRTLSERALAESEARFRRLAVHAPAVLAESRLDGLMTYVSPASLAITGYTPEELVGRPFDFWTEPEDSLKIRQMCETVIASRGRIAPWPIEFRARHKSGAVLSFECAPTPMHDAAGRLVGFSDIIRDISPRKALDAQMRAARIEAEDAARVKSEFLANMSHELRTPLTSIIGFTSLAAEQPDLPPLARTYISRVQDASQALLCTVNDILDFSKLEAGQLAIHPAPVDFGALCRSTLQLFAPQAGAKDLRLEFDGGGVDGQVLLLDADRIRQVLLNFIGNAVKFTSVGAVTLRVRYEAATEALAVEVIDSGAGIPAAKLGDLFKRFSQVDGSASRAAGGTGLGLAICKGLVEAMRGQVGVESREHEGSRFWFKLRAAPAQLSDEASADGAARSVAEGLRVLVADDHPTNRELVRLYLAAVGGRVTEAADGPEALRLARIEPFDVFLLDLRMPGMDGAEVLRRLRAEGGPNDMTPVLAYTADAGETALAALHMQGFDGVVAKPVKPADLIAAVARATTFEPIVTAAMDDADAA